MGGIEIRRATRADLPAILEAEQHWPEEQRASEGALTARLERHPNGFLLALEEDRIVGFTTSGPSRYDPTDLREFASWKQATNDGYLWEEPPRDCNALYVVSTLVCREERGGEILEQLAAGHRHTATSQGFEFVLTGATIPGYDAHCRRHGECAAADYALDTRRGRPRDPFLRILAGLGLHLPDARHVIPDYYPSPPSRNYGALLVGRVANGPARTP